MRDRAEKGDTWGSKMPRAEEARTPAERGRGSEAVTGAGRLALDGRAHLSSTAWGRWESGLWLKVGAGVGFLSTAEGPPRRDRWSVVSRHLCSHIGCMRMNRARETG